MYLCPSLLHLNNHSCSFLLFFHSIVFKVLKHSNIMFFLFLCFDIKINFIQDHMKELYFSESPVDGLKFFRTTWQKIDIFPLSAIWFVENVFDLRNVLLSSFQLVEIYFCHMIWRLDITSRISSLQGLIL